MTPQQPHLLIMMWRCTFPCAMEERHTVGSSGISTGGLWGQRWWRWVSAGCSTGNEIALVMRRQGKMALEIASVWTLKLSRREKRSSFLWKTSFTGVSEENLCFGVPECSLRSTLKEGAWIPSYIKWQEGALKQDLDLHYTTLLISRSHKRPSVLLQIRPWIPAEYKNWGWTRISNPDFAKFRNESPFKTVTRFRK